MKSFLELITGKKKKSAAEVTTPTKKIVCDHCKADYMIPISANFMYFCPACKEPIGFECEYGFAAITPCQIYLGEKLIVQLLGGARGPYRLQCRTLHINTTLTKGYEKCAVYEEAKEIITGKLKKQQ